jgi:LemA protein
MKKGLAVGLGCLAIIVLVVLILGVSAWKTYNNMVELKIAVESAWAQVENVYQRRADLIPNLVATVKGYASHEKEVFESVAASRAQVGSIKVSAEMLNNPAEFQKFQQAQAGLTSALSRLLAVAENYPELKANQNFLELQNQLEGTENRIAVERRRFNEVTQAYNTRIMQFPANIFAGIFNFHTKEFFKAAEGSDKAPVVDFTR